MTVSSLFSNMQGVVCIGLFIIIIYSLLKDLHTKILLNKGEQFIKECRYNEAEEFFSEYLNKSTSEDFCFLIQYKLAEIKYLQRMYKQSLEQLTIVIRAILNKVNQIGLEDNPEVLINTRKILSQYRLTHKTIYKGYTFSKFNKLGVILLQSYSLRAQVLLSQSNYKDSLKDVRLVLLFAQSIIPLHAGRFEKEILQKAKTLINEINKCNPDSEIEFI
jgi:hypothetical protein